MKNKKKILLGLTAVASIIIFLMSTGLNIEYAVAELIYGNENHTRKGVVFSKESGFYEDDFYLAIYAPSEEIYYTLDGSDPDKSSIRYEEPILISDATHSENVYSLRTDLSGSFLTGSIRYKVPDHFIDKCTVIKTTYYDKVGKKSETQERVFFVGFEEKTGYENINVISVTMEPEDLFSEDRGIYVLGDTFKKYAAENAFEECEDYTWNANYKNSGKDWERPALIQVFDKGKDLVLSQKVGVRIQGGVSRAFYPKSLNFYARKEYGKNQMQYDFFGTGYYPQRVTLSNGGNDYYGKMKDRLGAELTRNYDFCTMHYEPYALFLNGEYWGFYYLTEKYDENYIEYYYHIDKDNVIIFKQGGLEVGIEEDYDTYEEMKTFIETADMTIEGNYQQACTMIDIDSFIDYYSAEIYMARNADWPSGNYAMWRTRKTSEKIFEDGKWRWMLFDVNTSSWSDSLIEHDTLAYVLKKCEMFSNLSRNEQFREKFSDKLREMRDVCFEKNIVNEKLNEYEMLMNEPMEKYFQRFFRCSNNMFYERLNSMGEFAAMRGIYIEKMLKSNGFN